MADNLTVPSYEQIATILTKLATNYSNLASSFYDVFYSTVPQDITLEMFDETGVLREYTIPNRAKDMLNILSGEGSPEGKVLGSTGQIYQDLEEGDLYIKETEDGNQGWAKISTMDFLKSIFIQGVGSPEGNVIANKGVLYIDVNSASLYIKTTETGSAGWEKISTSVAEYANVDLSNLSSVGQSVLNDFANTSLSNLSVDGELVLASKENVSNKVTSISDESTDEEYPSAKCMYDLIGNLESALEDIVVLIDAL